jgi:hypothetical protein
MLIFSFALCAAAGVVVAANRGKQDKSGGGKQVLHGE